jgi:hypothetical protein
MLAPHHALTLRPVGLLVTYAFAHLIQNVYQAFALQINVNPVVPAIKLLEAIMINAFARLIQNVHLAIAN